MPCGTSKAVLDGLAIGSYSSLARALIHEIFRLFPISLAVSNLELSEYRFKLDILSVDFEGRN